MSLGVYLGIAVAIVLVIVFYCLFHEWLDGDDMPDFWWYKSDGN